MMCVLTFVFMVMIIGKIVDDDELGLHLERTSCESQKEVCMF